MNFEELSEFKRDLKKLKKKYRTLDSDLAVVKKVLEFSPAARSPFSYRIDNLGLETCIIKVKKKTLQSTERKRCKFRIAFDLCLF